MQFLHGSESFIDRTRSSDRRGSAQIQSTDPDRVLMTAEDDGSLHIESTNTDISVSVHLAANVQKAGRIAVPARKFGDYLGTLPGRCDHPKNQRRGSGDGHLEPRAGASSLGNQVATFR